MKQIRTNRFNATLDARRSVRPRQALRIEFGLPFSFPVNLRVVPCPRCVLDLLHSNVSPGCSNRHHGPMRCLLLLSFLIVLEASALAQTPASRSHPPTLQSYLIEVAGRVEYTTPGNANWQAAGVGLALQPGSRVRTLAESRAAVQLSDRSVIRLNERTTLEILPPRGAEKKRFSLPRGSLYFFNREKPADVEFDTPLAAGAIRGTEFVLEVAEDESALRLGLIDGRVALQTGQGEITLERGEDLRLVKGQAVQRTALVNVPGAIQWALYYPAVLNPAELGLSAGEQNELRQALRLYTTGDLLGALGAWPAQTRPATPETAGLRAALELAVGRVPEAEALLNRLPANAPASRALRELMAAIKGEAFAPATPPNTSSEWLAHTYTLQATADLRAALAAAKAAVAKTPDFGFARARLAELEFASGHYRAALIELEQALDLSPRLAPAYGLRGFIYLEQGQTEDAQQAFGQAREIDAAYGPAWLGDGLCLMRERRFAEARAAFQAASALEPQRGLFRAYLGKAASEVGDSKAAEKEFRLAKNLNPRDPTGWLYSALELWQQNRLNEAIRDLEKSIDLNDQLAPFRSRLLLESDRSVRSADLAAMYNEAGFAEVSRHTAARSATEDYANFSGHLFLADSYRAQEDVNQFNLRLETARQSELLLANLLAPPGAGNLSQQLTEREHLRFFDPRPVGASSETDYSSRGDWLQASTFFGSLRGFSYALDARYESFNGQRPNNNLERQQFVLTLKQRLTPEDDLYFQAGYLRSDAGDVASYFDPRQAKLGFRVHELQEPALYAGWHHAWSPGSHTLFLAGRLTDSLSLFDPAPNVLFLYRSGGQITNVQSPPFGPAYQLNFSSDFTLYSAELQQIWQTERQSLALGGRWQSGDVTSRAQLNRVFTTTDQNFDTSFQREDVYAYYSWHIFQPLRLIAGISYDRLRFPENTDLAPISPGETTKDLVSPKFGALLTPWDRGLIRATYARSLGGLFFDNSVRLEPTQIAGFNQAFRSLIPESVAGLVPGSQFETAGVGFDQSFANGTWFGLEAEWLTSHGSRTVGAFTNSTFLPIPDSISSTRQTLDFCERNLSAYGAQLLGDWVSISARYRLSDATLNGRFPQIPDTAAGLSQLEQHQQASLHQLSFGANLNHPSGLFAQWESSWYRQHNSGYTTALTDADFWQHNVFVGCRTPRRYAEIRLGILNLSNTNYRLNPLNLHADLPRARTFAASLRFNF